MPQPGTWARFFHFPSEGRHAEGYSDTRKIQRLQPASNLRTRVPEASMLTTRPPKPPHSYNSDKFCAGYMPHMKIVSRNKWQVCVGKTKIALNSSEVELEYFGIHGSRNKEPSESSIFFWIQQHFKLTRMCLSLLTKTTCNLCVAHLFELQDPRIKCCTVLFSNLINFKPQRKHMSEPIHVAYGEAHFSALQYL